MADAIELLKKDHAEMKTLLDKLVGSSERAAKTRAKLLAEIADMLSLHTAVEEELFYPRVREEGKKEQAVLVQEALEEHRAVEELVLPDLLRTEPDSIEFSGRAKVLRELILHHAEEEEKEMFPAAKKLLGNEELRELGERIEERKGELSKK